VSRLSSNEIELEYEEYGETTAPPAVLISGLGEQMGGVEFPRFLVYVVVAIDEPLAREAWVALRRPSTTQLEAMDRFPSGSSSLGSGS
jgi:hypothetical protein